MKRFFSVLVALTILATPIFAQQVQFPYISTDATPLRAMGDNIGTSTTTLFTARGAGVRVYMTQISCINSTTTAGIILDIHDGGVAAGGNGARIAQVPCPASGVSPTTYFTPPLKFSANTQVNINVGTTSLASNGGIHVLAIGFTGR